MCILVQIAEVFNCFQHHMVFFMSTSYEFPKNRPSIDGAHITFPSYTHRGCTKNRQRLLKTDFPSSAFPSACWCLVSNLQFWPAWSTSAVHLFWKPEMAQARSMEVIMGGEQLWTLDCFYYCVTKYMGARTNAIWLKIWAAPGNSRQDVGCKKNSGANSLSV